MAEIKIDSKFLKELKENLELDFGWFGCSFLCSLVGNKYSKERISFENYLIKNFPKNNLVRDLTTKEEFKRLKNTVFKDDDSRIIWLDEQIKIKLKNEKAK